jgi:hypothetical protein
MRSLAQIVWYDLLFNVPSDNRASPTRVLEWEIGPALMQTRRGRAPTASLFLSKGLKYFPIAVGKFPVT